MFENQNNSNPKSIIIFKIDPLSVIKVVLVLLGFWFLYFIRDIIFMVLVAVFLAVIINPTVNFFERKKFPRWLGALIVYLFILLVLIGISFAIWPTIVEQSKFFINQVPDVFQSIVGKIPAGAQEQFLKLGNQWLNQKVLGDSNMFSLLGNTIGQIISLFVVLIIAFYLSIQKKTFYNYLNLIIPIKYRHFFEHFMRLSQKEVSGWAIGQFLICLSIGILTYIGLFFLKVKFALILAIIAGFTEIIPFIGAVLGAAPAVIIAFVQSPLLGLLVIILYVIIQQIGHLVISPNIMYKVVGLNPAMALVVLLIGGRLAGPVGMLISVPIATVISILIRDYFKEKREVEVEEKNLKA
ncbi:MAG: AI-2E family transporter [Patescibacteria group bacterium]|nr:AI-2E family transporter [Patescibacteria group bacterium]